MQYIANSDQKQPKGLGTASEGIWGTGYFFPPSFLLWVVKLEGTRAHNLLIHGSMASVTDTALVFLTIGRPIQHLAC